MVSRYDVIKAFNLAKERGDKLELGLSEDEQNIISAETGEVLCDIDTYVSFMREKLNCDFEVVYSEHISLDVVYRCKKCGTVIFSGDDERYDPNLKCPTCSDYKPHCMYWPKDEIDNDPKKSLHIYQLEELERLAIEAEKRRKARGGLYDWQRWVKKINTKNHHIVISHICFGYGVKNMRKDRYLEIMDYERDENGHFLYGKDIGHCFKIPLSFYNIYIRWIYPYSSKCTPDLRKYHFWQKKPTNLNYEG